MSHKVCERCAKEFHGQPWRAGCDRCGSLVAVVEDTTIAKAKARAEADGWRNGTRYRPSGGKSVTTL